MARAIFAQDKTELITLSLTGAMSESVAGFLTDAYALFENANRPEIQAQLASYIYDSAKLQREPALVAAYEAANLSQEQSKSAAQQATRDQDAAQGQ